MKNAPMDDETPQGLSLTVVMSSETKAWLRDEAGLKIRGDVTVRCQVDGDEKIYTESLYVMWQIIGLLCEDANDRMQSARNDTDKPNLKSKGAIRGSKGRKQRQGD